MCISPTKPVRNVATKSTFEVDEIHAVLVALLLPALDTTCRALTANQFFRLKLLFFLLRSNAVLLASEVSILTFKALIVCQFKHRKGRQIVVERIFGIFQSGIFV